MHFIHPFIPGIYSNSLFVLPIHRLTGKPPSSRPQPLVHSNFLFVLPISRLTGKPPHLDPNPCKLSFRSPPYKNLLLRFFYPEFFFLQNPQ
ncbi:hypothetical protein CEXT_696661 [Caerostris extrusa]|uniref:Uncharacterized protein n=1 Tax=Caerostris extrusa TaxID=172846 RepID=A0AAV4N665_CAEEX|nr:hypothetical protein CEXT_696661 [Caerostris extrusa]